MQLIKFNTLISFFLIGLGLLFLTPQSSYGQDLSLPPLPVDPSGKLDTAALPPIVEIPVQSIAETALPNVSDEQAADNQQKQADRSQVLQTRAAEDSLDDLMPTAIKPSAEAAKTSEIPATSSGVTANIEPVKAPESQNVSSATPSTQGTQNADPEPTKAIEDDALQGLPALPDPLAANQPKKPLTLEEEAAAAGFIRPESNENLPDLSAQALLSGQPMAPDDEDNLVQQLPKENIKKKKQSYRDLPKIRPVIQPLRHSFNYRRTTLPPSIYRKQYSGDNRYLPLATYREDYDRALFYAVAANDINGTRAFLERGANINMLNTDGDTLLITAVRYRAFDTARLLLARGANPTIRGSGGITAIQYAIASKQSELATILRARGA